ncbi:Chromosome III, complete sequence, related [Eimeria necatrix]|uniref:Chromosome III, complete sequence, related n=1 Tax=Eimeria necatrix TaxID=51315 RepID=U6MWN9_9EIME|nr:Chromosome III, complete sequence, related [Eimeria necatrix]CDJ67428.1 Chromosome III, complete sequence, related [Eimeria necatrix]
MANLLHLSRLRRLCALFLCRVSFESNGPSRCLSNFFFFLSGSASSRLGARDQCFVFSSIFFLEAYHSEGAGEAWGWLGAICFKLAAFAEIAALAAWGSSSFEVLDAAFTVMLGVSLSIAFLWSLFFEPASHRFDVRLTQSAMRNEYYKSRNAMAYYGPAVVNADGEIDIAAAAEQAQACLNCTPC